MKPFERWELELASDLPQSVRRNWIYSFTFVHDIVYDTLVLSASFYNRCRVVQPDHLDHLSLRGCYKISLWLLKYCLMQRPIIICTFVLCSLIGCRTGKLDVNILNTVPMETSPVSIYFPLNRTRVRIDRSIVSAILWRAIWTASLVSWRRTKTREVFCLFVF